MSPAPHQRLHNSPCSPGRRTLGGGQNGMTLIELLVASAILLVVMSAIYSIWAGLQNTYMFTAEDMLAQDQARTAMGEMVESIRTARVPASVPSETYNAVIPIAQRNSITVWTDIDKDANHDLELVRYRVDTSHRILYRDQATITDHVISWTSEKLVTTNVGNGQNDTNLADQSLWLFTYYDANGNLLPYDDHEGDDSEHVHHKILDPTAIREVRISLLVDIYVDRAPVTHQLTSVVQPRNLRQY
jgi:prepilin-type N-terminal cleavage/methylation domain-containing protein